ncbi:p74 [Anticarsia gemmatalis nucleopolyhedrovirus]|uniref:p74 n=1 Tax=Anticarsia gemmatalis multiple nucleopolyhedrovirus TaxID=268591 RepID=A0A0S3IXB9_9ABAC|nr:p74 [Anticarsia gemmatalis nucleopolyhedrovirus]ABI13917.1 p74 [Anticarsia gemmatalis multiple nucleopolyhedrovirus]ALR70615.1 p74 [Anticarsia gemmatalis multiple nucleopolyhedrovirus]ALR72188.1 p74 [Anticarsia gemmatalis multiple nucleopolyhedrovirus]ALR72344.1 p74 [Anticarsia gemmatalis multiple nucleopolyhedrovirus]AXE72058.1 p74 [Anticarsia gemmatalis multiple nucleopolyhedrovirus]
MAVLTAVDLTNASRYATHMHRLEFIERWRTRLPHILIDYTLRPASSDDDYYVPPLLRDRALAVKLAFSRRGCDSMSCYPFHETGVVSNQTPFMYTQTSETSVAYAQPACYHLDRAAAMRDGAENNVQSAEFTYTPNNQCVMVDSTSKMYFNSPYLRTEEHTIMGVDDVPAFNVRPDPDPLFPERFKGEFNDAYCRRFGRELMNGGCSLRWWESLIGFVLGDTLYVTFKMLANNIFSELRDFDYTSPSPILPPRPAVDSNAVLAQWRAVRDRTINYDFEKLFSKTPTLQDLGMVENGTLMQLTYTAEVGFTKTPITYETRGTSRSIVTARTLDRSVSDKDLELIISQFLEDYSFVFSIATDIGFDMLMTAFKTMLKKINTALIPSLKRMLMSTSQRVTVRLLGETYKAAMVHSINRIAIKTLTTAAKSLTRIAIKAASVVGIVLILLSLADLVLALWDPFGYNNMFPREFPDDLSRTFLTAYFETLDANTSREIIEFLPEFFSDIVETDDDATFQSLFHLLDYVAALEVNSDGQMLQLDESDVIKDFDETTLVGQALASSSLYTRLEFMQYTFRQNTLLEMNENNNKLNRVVAGLFLLNTGAAAAAFILHRELTFFVYFAVFLMIALYYLVKEPYEYFKTIDLLF